MSFEKFWQWQGLSPCEIKWRSPINRAAICFFLLLMYCATIYATFSYINTKAFTIEQIGPNLAKKPISGDTDGSQRTAFKNKKQSICKSQEQLQLAAHTISGDREPTNPQGSELDADPVEETNCSHTQKPNICGSSFERAPSDTTVGMEFKEVNSFLVEQIIEFLWMLLNKTSLEVYTALRPSWLASCDCPPAHCLPRHDEPFHTDWSAQHGVRNFTGGSV